MIPAHRYTHLLLATGLGGGLYGAAEAARVLSGSRLYLGGGDVILVLGLGAVGPAALAMLTVPVLAILPSRPLGRQRWFAFLVGAGLAGGADLGVWWFSDPPPFVDPLPFQGNPLAFLGVSALLAAVGLGVYQAVRGARSVAGAVLGIATALSISASTSRSGPAAPTESLPQAAPNVLVVTLDTTRADHVGAYGRTGPGGGVSVTPAFDALAKDGALFMHASAVLAVTGPSHASMFTGSGPWDHGVLLNGIPVPTDRTLLAEVLHDHGWATGAFVSSYVLDGQKGFRRGFEVYDDDFGSLPGVSGLLLPRLYAMVGRHLDPDEQLERRAGPTTDHAIDWINDHASGPRAGAPWFAWVHMFDPHGPYEPPPPYDTRYYEGDHRDPAHTSMQGAKNVAVYLKKSLDGITDVNYVLAQYDGEISYADAQLMRLTDTLESLGVANNTLVVVIADHGESFGEHGVWFNHGDDVYETSLHVPFVVRYPGRVTAGTRVERPFEGTDLAPTLLDLLGLPAAPSMTGVSAAGLIGDHEGKGRTIARSMCFDREANVAGRAKGEITKPKWRMTGLRGPASRYVERETGDAPEYFDLASDPAGERDVVANVGCTPAGVELLSILRGQASQLFSSNATERSSAEVSPEERAKLEALGYLSGTDEEGAGGGPAAAAVDTTQPCPVEAPPLRLEPRD
ncbi:MAG: hypothetical protein EXR69_01050 [Myxococcales bacterium]|nr:hypothetical protein [Myxococcales bacterium]